MRMAESIVVFLRGHCHVDSDIEPHLTRLLSGALNAMSDEYPLARERERNPLDFYSISQEERAVFPIEPERAPALNHAYNRYMRMVGHYSCSNDLEERQRANDRAAFQSSLQEDPAIDQNLAQNARLCALFMHNHCDVPFDQAFFWHRKVEAQEFRQGINTFNGVTVSAHYQRLCADRTNKLTVAAQRPED